MFHIVLIEPEIPPNTGNLIRLAANSGCRLHLVEPLGFALDEKSLRRAGLDYADLARVNIWRDWRTLLAAAPFKRWVTLSTRHQQLYSDFKFAQGDALVFGAESKGLAAAIRDSNDQAAKLTLPMKANNRSLNLSNSVAIVVYEAWRQHDFATA